jgi:tetratricopeptide (TPR) repeat protein
MERMAAVNRALFNLDRPFPLPTSFLVDARGRIAVIYKAPVTVEGVLADAAALGSRGPESGDRAAPFPGRWQSNAMRSSRAPLRPRDVLMRLGMSHWQAGDAVDAAAVYREALRVDPNHAQAHTYLAVALSQLGDEAGAEAELWQALRLPAT